MGKENCSNTQIPFSSVFNTMRNYGVSGLTSIKTDCPKASAEKEQSLQWLSLKLCSDQSRKIGYL